MLARYKIYRGKPPADVTLPDGIRQDTRKHTRHCLRPTKESVAAYLPDPSEQAWQAFAAAYLATINERFFADSTPFDELATLATDSDIFLGCSCPTAKNPDVQHCHTVLALKFMSEHYAQLEIEYPD